MVKIYWRKHSGSSMKERIVSVEKADTLMFLMNAKHYVQFYCEGIYDEMV